MIGRNDVADETFTLEDVDRLSAFALARGLAGVHHWSYDRDVPCTKKAATDTCNSMGPFTARHGCLDRFLAGRMRWSASVAGLKPGAGEVNNRYAA